MRTISNERFVATKVQIEFEDGPMSVSIPHGATLGDVSEKLHNICKWHRGGALSIDVRFGAAATAAAPARSPRTLLEFSTERTAGYVPVKPLLRILRKKAKPMPVHAQTDLASAILTEIPHLRAYARLMTNDRSEAEREVEATIKSVSADDILWSDKAQLRVSLFKILRGYLARDQRSMLQRDIPHSYGNLCSYDAATGAANSDAQTVRDVGPTLLRLDFGDREAIILSAAAKFSDLEIAEICGCAPETVRGRVHRGRAQLAKILRVEFVEDLKPVTVPAAALDVRDAEFLNAV